MNIDIITYQDAQIAELSDEQLVKVQEAQIKKNRLRAKLDEDVAAAKLKYAKNGVFLSDLYSQTISNLTATYNREVEWIREGLLFYLQYSNKKESDEGYVMDYSLNMEARYALVRDFYIFTYTDPVGRFQEFLSDRSARRYLGEYYNTLYDYLLELSENALRP